MKLFKKHPLFFLMLLGLLLRLSLMFLDYSWDVNNHMSWATDLFHRGFPGFYETQSSNVFASIYPNYPPLAMFIFYAVYPLQLLFEKLSWFLNITIPIFPSKLIFFIQSRTFLAGVLKLPAIFADLGIAWICYLFAKKLVPKNVRLHLLILSLVLFNPAFFYNSAYWGQIDSTPLFFVLASVYFLLFSTKSLLSGVLFAIALLIKPTALVYLPVYIVVFIRKFGLKKFAITSLLNIVILYLSFLPFYKSGNVFVFPWETYKVKILDAQSLPYVTNGAFNFWLVFTQFKGIKDTTSAALGVSYRMWGYVITALIYSFIIYHFSLKNKKIHIQNSFYAAFLAAFTAFLFLTKMHERYLMLPLPFLLLATIKNKGLLKWFVALSAISFFNLYHSWPVPKVELLSQTLDSPIGYTSLSVGNILLFMYLFCKYVLLDIRKKGV